MPRKRAARPSRARILPQPVPALATAARLDGDGAVTLRIVFQPQDAGKISDQLVNALVRRTRRS